MSGPARRLRDRLASVPWLYERTRLTVSAVVAVLAIVAIILSTQSLEWTASDTSVLVVAAYLVVYFVITVWAFSTASHADISRWAEREDRGSVLERYVYGTAPGPGVSLSFATGALVVAVLWMPGVLDSALSEQTRVAVAIPLVAIAWASVVVSFAVTFYADNLFERQGALEFPGRGAPRWSDYLYFALSVMTTFGTTDVSVTSNAMRRTVSINGVIAFVYNSVVVAALVSALTTVA